MNNTFGVINSIIENVTYMNSTNSTNNITNYDINQDSNNKVSEKEIIIIIIILVVYKFSAACYVFKYIGKINDDQANEIDVEAINEFLNTNSLEKNKVILSLEQFKNYLNEHTIDNSFEQECLICFTKNDKFIETGCKCNFNRRICLECMTKNIEIYKRLVCPGCNEQYDWI